MIILCIVEVVIVLLLVFLRKRILIAIALIKEASRSGCPPVPRQRWPSSPVAAGGLGDGRAPAAEVLPAPRGF